MYQYAFLSSAFCNKVIQINVEPPPFQHLLPPDSQLPKLGKQSYKNQDILLKKNEQLKFMTQKNNQLMFIVSKKQSDIARLTKRYNQLLQMYEQIKNNGITLGMQTKISLLNQQNDLLCEKIRRLENQLIESQKQIIRKVKFYEQKNDQSRRLLQKLNQNIIKRQQKLKMQLTQAQSQLKRKNELIGKIQQENRNLQLNSSSDKQEQATRIIQQTQREKSVIISSIQSKINLQNYKLNQQITHLTKLMNEKQTQNLRNIQRLNQNTQLLQNQNEKLKSQLQNEKNKLDTLQLMYKQLQGRHKLLQSDRNQKQIQYQNRVAENAKQKKKLKQVQGQLQKNMKQMDEILQKYQLVLQINKKYEFEIKQNNIQIQKCRQFLKEKIERIAELQINYQQQKKISQQYARSNDQLQKSNQQLTIILKKNNKKIESLQELLQNFKAERVKVRGQMDNQWKQMTDFYQKQIEKLQNRIIQSQTKPNFKQKAPALSAIGNNVEIS